jgi:hypothetical protein
MEAPQNWRLYWKMESLVLWPTYIGEKGRTLGKTYWIKARCYWEHPWGTHWEPSEYSGNLMGIWMKHVGNKGKKNPPLSPKTWKKKNQGTLSACWTFPAWNFYFQKPFITISGLG